MIFRIYYEKRGGHVHCRLFAGEQEGALGKCGDLCMRVEEFSNFMRLRRLVEFRPESGAEVIEPPADGRPCLDGVITFCLEPVCPRDQDDRAYQAVAKRVKDALHDSFDIGFKAAGGEIFPLAVTGGEGVGHG